MLPDQLKEDSVAVALEARFPDAITGGHAERNEPTLMDRRRAIVEVCRFFEEGAGFRSFERHHGGGLAPADPRFEVVYLLHSLDRNTALASEVLGRGIRVRNRFRDRRLAHRQLV
jgi:NADH-quinone oxidoreductase subunit C